MNDNISRNSTVRAIITNVMLSRFRTARYDEYTAHGNVAKRLLAQCKH